MNNINIEDVYYEHYLNFNLFQGVYESILKIDLIFRDEKIGGCSIHVFNHDELLYCDNIEQTLFFFFDDIEVVASINFSELCQSNKWALEEMVSYRFAYLTDMVIKPEYRNMGVGSIFLNSIEEALVFMNIDRVFLVSAMYEDNRTPYRNENFYVKNGYEIINDSMDIYNGKMMYKRI